MQGRNDDGVARPGGSQRPVDVPQGGLHITRPVPGLGGLGADS